MFRGLGYVCVLMQLIFILNKITTNVFFEIPCKSEPMFTQPFTVHHGQVIIHICNVIFSSTQIIVLSLSNFVAQGS